MHVGEGTGIFDDGDACCVPSTSPYICDFEISPARVEGDGGVQEESGLVFPQVVLQIQSGMIALAPAATLFRHTREVVWMCECIDALLPRSGSINPRRRL